MKKATKPDALDRFQNDGSRSLANLYDVDNILAVAVDMLNGRDPTEFQGYTKEEFAAVWFGLESILKCCREILNREARRLDQADTDSLPAQTRKRTAA